jgi:DNA (cytosine-5)-methyltransferase 1
VGVDIVDQPRYPFRFVRADALAYLAEHWQEFDAIHASPVCKGYATINAVHGTWQEMRLPEVRTALQATGRPWVLENVPQAPFEHGVLLCGGMFGLRVRRHRRFETPFLLWDPPSHACPRDPVGVYGHPGGSSKRDGLRFGGVETWRETMEIPWMTSDELSQAIPPAYTRYVGTHLLSQVRAYREEHLA